MSEQILSKGKFPPLNFFVELNVLVMLSLILHFRNEDENFPLREHLVAKNV